jgi:hypothetical protein
MTELVEMILLPLAIYRAVSVVWGVLVSVLAS